MTAPLILHIDVDAFFASVEQLLIPFLRGKPVIVGNGCIASCSYEARKFSLRAGMALGKARKLCPSVIILSGNSHIYRCFAEQIWQIVRRYTVGLETYLDEAYGDATGMDRVHGDAITLGRRLQQDVRDEVGLPVSVGLAANRMVAGIASHLAKPHGVAHVPPGTEETFLGPLPVEELTGVGHKTADQLHDMNIQTVEQLRAVPLATMTALLGRRGEVLYERCRGHDVAPPIQPADAQPDEGIDYELVDQQELSDCGMRIAECGLNDKKLNGARSGSEGAKGAMLLRRCRLQKHADLLRGMTDCELRNANCEFPSTRVDTQDCEKDEREKHRSPASPLCSGSEGVVRPPRRLPRSISRETTFHQSLCDLDHIRGMLYYLLERAMRTARQAQLTAQCVEVHIRYDDFKGDAASKSLPEPTDSDDDVFPIVLQLLSRLHHRRVALRHAGVTLSRLARRQDNGTLFDFHTDERKHELYQTLDEIRDRFGHASVVTGKSIELLGRLEQDDHGFILRTPSLTK